jgi:hypothetical protein
MTDKKQLTLRLPRENRHKAYLQMINGILKLSDMELSVLGEFLDLNSSQMCSSKDRQVVKKKFNIKNVNVYVKKFKDKGLIALASSPHRGIYQPNQLILPPEESLILKMHWE